MKGARVGLVQAPVWWTIDPPLGLAQIAGCLKAAGCQTHVLDLNILLYQNRPPQYENMWLWEQFHFWNQPAVVEKFFADNAEFIGEHLERLLKSDARVIGFSVGLGSQLPSLKLARMIKEADPKRLIVFGGQYFFRGTKAEEMLGEHPEVDVIIKYAGDEIFPALVADFAATGRVVKRPGLAFRDGAGGIVDGGPAAMPRLLDKVPFADFTGFPMELYTDPDRIPIAASRGCVWACRFCSTREFWNTYSYMSGDRIFAEARFQRLMFPSRGHIEFYDITANGHPETLDRFSDLVIDWHHGFHLPFGWKINAILRPEMTAELLRKMRISGCNTIIYGVESGSPRVLKMMNKNYNVGIAERVLRDTHQAGIPTTGNFMFGFPGETEEDFRMTLDFVRRNATSLDKAYASATFTSLEEYSYLTENQEKFGIKKETLKDAHNLYWETNDGENTYPVRLDRYQRFRRTCIELGIDAYKGINGSLEQDEQANLAQYYQYVDDRVKAVNHFVNYLELDLMNEPMRDRLAGYRADLRRLVRALRLVERANARLGAMNGKSDRLVPDWRERLDREERLPMPVSAVADDAARCQLYLARAQRIVEKLRFRGLVKWAPGGFQIWWERSALPSSGEIAKLSGRVEDILRLAAGEARAEAAGPARAG